MRLPEGFGDLSMGDPRDHGLVVKVVTITPEAAGKWLSFNHKHRSIRKKKVAEYASKMKTDEWVVNGKTIVFDYEGKLVGGQHRLSACVASGVPFTGLVVCGVDPQAVEREDGLSLSVAAG